MFHVFNVNQQLMHSKSLVSHYLAGLAVLENVETLGYYNMVFSDIVLIPGDNA